MILIPLNKLCKTEYHIKFLDALEMPQKPSNPQFNCMGMPKKQDLILYVKDCKTKYITKDKKIITTKPGQVVYIPKGSQYKVDCTHALSENSSTLQINFHLYDKDFNPCCISDEIRVFSTENHEMPALFEKALFSDGDFLNFPTEKKSILYNIINLLSLEEVRGKSNKIIEPGIEYIHTNYHRKCSVAEIAKLCHISEEYFRKLFKKQTGKNPAEYINMLRMQKARQYLIHSDISVAEISEMLGFATVSHFIKQFKIFGGTSPLLYRKRYR